MEKSHHDANSERPIISHNTFVTHSSIFFSTWPGPFIGRIWSSSRQNMSVFIVPLWNSAQCLLMSPAGRRHSLQKTKTFMNSLEPESFCREKEATNKKKRTRTRRTSESSESSESSTPPPAKRLSKTLGVKRPVRGGRGRGKN